MALTISKLRGRDFEGEIHRLITDKRLSEDHKKILGAFIDELRQGELSLGAQRLYSLIIRDLGIFLCKPYKDASREDIRGFVSTLEKRVNEVSLRTYKSDVKKFYRWLYNADEPPVCVSWIKTWGKPRKGKQELKIKDYIIKREEYLKLIEASRHERDQAIISLLWDTGGRAIEILATNLEDVDLNSDTPSIILAGKRKVPLIESLPYMTAWLNLHPHRREGKGPLWMGRRTKQLTYGGLVTMLEDTCKAASTRKITSKMFRHTRATLHAKIGLSPYVMNRVMGWTPDSKMYSVYLHLNGEDVVDGVREAYGLASKDEAPKPAVLKDCTRCHQKLPQDSKFCLICGMIQDPEEALMRTSEQESLRREIESLRSKLNHILSMVPAQS